MMISLFDQQLSTYVIGAGRNQRKQTAHKTVKRVGAYPTAAPGGRCHLSAWICGKKFDGSGEGMRKNTDGLLNDRKYLNVMQVRIDDCRNIIYSQVCIIGKNRNYLKKVINNRN
jgi:hypothetical protein